MVVYFTSSLSFLGLMLVAVVAPAAAQAHPQPQTQPAPQAAQDPSAAAAPAADREVPTETTPPPPAPPRSGNGTLDLEALTDAVDELRDQNEDLAAELTDLKEQQAARKQPARSNLMNPAITVFLNGAGRLDDRPVYASSGTRIDDRMFMRTAEFDFRAAVDPYADAVAILALEDAAGDGFEAELEEGYLVLKRVPILESAPLGLKLKIGRYRAPLGNVNRLHMHDLPWTSRPLPIVRFLGNEQGDFFEAGFNPEGIDAEIILPEIIPGVVMELNADVVDGGDIAISSGEHDHLGFLGHYNAFFTLADAHDFNLGLSAYHERGARRTRLLVADFLYKWKPLTGGEFKSFVLGGEVFHADRRFGVDTDGDDVPDAIGAARPLSGYAFAQYQLGWHVYGGVRYDYAEDITDAALTTQVGAAYLTYYTSEFLRFRAGYERRLSDLAVEDGVDSFTAEINVVFGSHPTEPYWVNR